jgi:hypothetical protein
MPPKVALSLSTLALVVSNLIPLGGVLFFDWDIFSIVVLYWAENIIVGLFTIARILVAAGSPDPKAATNPAARAFLAVFFTIHYGIFTTVHGVFIFALFSPDGFIAKAPDPSASDALQGGFALALLGLFISHAISFITNDLLGGERLRYSSELAMMRPYPRIIPLHVGIIFGGAAIGFLGSPLPLLLCLIFGKLFLDLSLHRRSHHRLQQGTTP